jgi:hypothetical protein
VDKKQVVSHDAFPDMLPEATVPAGREGMKCFEMMKFRALSVWLFLCER